MRVISQFIPIVLLWCLVGNTALAQHEASTHIETAIGVGGVFMRDQGMSPLLYGGIGTAIGVSISTTDESKTITHSFRHERGSLQNTFAHSVSFDGFLYRSTTLYHDEKGSLNRFLWGWSNSNYVTSSQNDRFLNFGQRINYFTAFGASALYSTEVALFGKTLLVEIPANMQLLGFFVGPSFVSSAPSGYMDSQNSFLTAFFQSVQLFYPGKAWNIDIAPTLTYRLSSGNSLSLRYQYEFTNINHTEPFHLSTGLWLLSLKTAL